VREEVTDEFIVEDERLHDIVTGVMWDGREEHGNSAVHALRRLAQLFQPSLLERQLPRRSCERADQVRMDPLILPRLIHHSLLYIRLNQALALVAGHVLVRERNHVCQVADDVSHVAVRQVLEQLGLACQPPFGQLAHEVPEHVLELRQCLREVLLRMVR
jgi:hypothetical protein